MVNTSGPLVIVTRPQPQADDWVARLRAARLDAQALPLLLITPSPQPAAVAEALEGLQPGDLALFVSPNAASAAWATVTPGWAWRSGVTAAGTGPGTVAVLQAHGVSPTDIVAPPPDAAQFDSETLWATLGQHPWAGRQVCIFRGEGGRDWLSERLQAMGATVRFVRAYGRTVPVWSAEQRAVLARVQQRPEQACWLLSSSEALDHLPSLAPTLDLAQCTALATHPRIAERARVAGWGQVLTAAAGFETVCDALMQWRRRLPGGASIQSSAT